MSTDSFTMRRCALPEIEAVEASSSHVFPRHTHEAYGVGLIVRGAHRSWSGRGTVEAGPGEIITCNPGEVHDGAPIGTSRAWKIVYLQPALVGAITADIRDGGAADFEFTDPVIKEQPPSRAFATAYDALTGMSAEPASAQERLMVLLAVLLKHKRPIPVAASHAVVRTKARIDDEPTARITLAELASEAGLSRFQLMRQFARFTGLTPHAYMVQRRLDAARTMLTLRVPISEAAAACGFADQSHFSRMFIARYGMTPGIYAAAHD